MKSKLFIGIEYRNEPNNPELSTYEIFDSVEAAYKFKHELEHDFIEAFVADFNLDDVYKEPENGKWNYEDNLHTYGYKLIFLMPEFN